MKTEVGIEELAEMRENVRRTVNALEWCWGCERISECEQTYVDDGAPVWLCEACSRKTKRHPRSSLPQGCYL